MTRKVLYLPNILWSLRDGTAQRGGWLVLEGQYCVQRVVAGPFATREEAGAAL